MDLNPREAVVDQEPPCTPEPEQGEERTHALIVPENFVAEAMDSLTRLADERGLGGGKIRIFQGSNCYWTHPARPHRDHHCLD